MIPRFATLSDTAEVNRICSHPEVRAWTASDGSPPFDAEKWLRRDCIVVLAGGTCFLANPVGSQTYQVHTNILQEARGKTALVNAGLSLMLAFLGTDAETFVTCVASNNLRAAWFTRAMGFRPTFVQPARWLHRGKMWDLTHYSLGVDEWILQGQLAPVGKMFHSELEGMGHKSHGEDHAHDCYVGAAVALISAGKPNKAAKIYNRWARAAGYVPLEIVSSDPLLIDVRDFLIRVEAGQIKLEVKEKEHA